MPRKCCVPGCRGNYDKNERVSVFRFPSDLSKRDLWSNKIPRSDFIVTDQSVVCERHFMNDFIIRTDSCTRADGSILSVERTIPKLRDDAYPSIFPNCLTSEVPTPKTKRKAAEQRRTEHFKNGCLDPEPAAVQKKEVKQRNPDFDCQTHTLRVARKQIQDDSPRCKYCMTVLDNRIYLEAHLYNAHGQSLEQDSVLCKLTSIKSEVQPHHVETSAELKSVDGDSSSPVMNGKDRKENRCSVCGKTFTRRSSMKRHMQTHTGDRCLKCNVCCKEFDSRRSLSVHKLTHKPLNCIQCNEIFYDRQLLLSHVGAHFNDNEICKATLNMEENLLIDNNSSPKMELDDNDMRKEETLFFHKEKPYECVYCERAYCHKRDLRRHHFNCHPELEYHAQGKDVKD